MEFDKTQMLKNFVKEFNDGLWLWEERTGMRANFGFRYKEDGRKEMYILDTAEAKTAPSTDIIDKVGALMAEAPNQVVDAGQ